MTDLDYADGLLEASLSSTPAIDSSQKGNEEDSSRRDGDKNDREREVGGGRKRSRSRGDSRSPDRHSKRRRTSSRERSRDRGRDDDREHHRSRSSRQHDRDSDRDHRRGQSADRDRDRHRDRDRDRHYRSRRSGSKDRYRDDRRDERDRRRDYDRRRRSPHRRRSPPPPREEDAYTARGRSGVVKLSTDRDFHSIFVHGLTVKADEKDVREFFSEAGKVVDVKLVRDRVTKKSKGFGYVEMGDRDGVNAAILLSGQQIKGVPVWAQASQAEKNREREVENLIKAKNYPKIHVGSLDPLVTATDLESVFREYGQIENVEVETDALGRNKGYAYILFKDSEGARRALTAVNGKELGGAKVKISFVTNKVDKDGKPILDTSLDRLTKEDTIIKMKKAQGQSASYSLMQKLSRSKDPLAEFQEEMEAAAPEGVIASHTIRLTNMWDKEEAHEQFFEDDLKQDIQEECQKFGTVKYIGIDHENEGHVYIKFMSISNAGKALSALQERWFGGKQIEAIFINEASFREKFGRVD